MKTQIDLDPVFVAQIKEIPDKSLIQFYTFGNKELWEAEMIRRGLLK